MNTYESKRVGIVGAGPAGLMAAGTALLSGAEVTVFDHSGRPGKKLSITGKGRCNVTNQCTTEEFLANVPRNPRFLYAALGAFSTEDTMQHFSSLGVPLKVERGRRVFPESDRAADITAAMRAYAGGASFVFEHVRAVSSESGALTVMTDKGTYVFDAVILACGGRSYPLTGSDGSGYRLARALGHTVTPIRPSLVPLESSSGDCERLQGLSLRNVSIRIKDMGGRVLYEDFGEMLFTHFGVSGPTVLSASAHLSAADISSLTLSIDLKPALDEKQLDARLLSDFFRFHNKDLQNALGDLLPRKLHEVFIERTGIDARKKVHDITKEERRRMVSLLKGFDIPLSGYRPIEV